MRLTNVLVRAGSLNDYGDAGEKLWICLKMRMDIVEKKALKYALEGFRGQAYLFGSRVDDKKRGGDIDILLFPEKKMNSLKLSIKIQARFFAKCEEKIDVIVYDEKSLFCKEIIKNAKRIDSAGI
jgi:predicted nucleotidyltransferase